MSSSRTFVRSLVVCLAVGSGLIGVATDARAQIATASPGDAATAPSISDSASIDHVLPIPSVLQEPTKSSPRPRALVPLWISFAALQALDMRSTLSGLQAGGREANPVVGTVVGSGAGFASLKIASAGAVIYMTGRVRKRHPAAAIVTMIALDSAYAIVVAHNYALQGR